MNHRRWVGLFLFVLYAAQGAILLTQNPASSVVIFVEVIIGLAVLSYLLVDLSKRITTSETSLTISGFYVGIPQAEILASDLISVKFRWVFTAGGRSAFQFAVVGIRAQSSRGDFQVPIVGWWHNRELFGCLAKLVSESGIPVDDTTAKMLSWASGSGSGSLRR